MNLSTSFRIKQDNAEPRNLSEHLVWNDECLILQKVSKSFIDIQLSSSLNKKAALNLFMLNDYECVSELKITKEWSESDSFLTSLPYFIDLFLSNSGVNHINVQMQMYHDWTLETQKISALIRRNLLRWGLKKRKGNKLSFQKQLDDRIENRLDFFNYFLRTCKLSSFNWQNNGFLTFNKFRYTSLERRTEIQVSSAAFQKFLRYLANFSEFSLEGNITAHFDPQFLNFLHPPSSLPNGNTQSPSEIRLQSLVLNPFDITPSNMTYLFDVLKFANQLKTLTIGIQGFNDTKRGFQESPMPTNLSVEEFTLEIWGFKTDKELTASLSLFLGSIDIGFPSLRKFSLLSRRQGTDYLFNKKPSTLKLGSFLKNLANLKHLQNLLIDSDICKSIVLDNLEGCSVLTSLKIVTNPILESAKMKSIPQNVTDLNLTFELLKQQGVRFARGHTQLMSDYFSSLKINKAASDNIETLTLTGYEIYPKIAGLMQFTSLLTLNLIDCRINEENLSQILNWEGLVCLKELNLSKTLLVEPTQTQMKCNVRVFTILEKTRVVEQLEVLDLSDFRLSPDLQSPKDSQRFKNLRKLNMRENYLQVEGLRTILDAKFPRLEELDIQNLDIVPNTVINELLERIKLIDHMKYIQVSHSANLEHGVDVQAKRFNEKAMGHPRLRLDMNSKFVDYHHDSRFVYFK